MKYLIILSFFVFSGCATQKTDLNIRVKSPSYGECNQISDFWEKAELELNFNCSIR